MLHYSLKSAIPTESPSKGLFYTNNKLYFACNTFLYKYTNDLCDIYATLQSNIRQFVVKDDVAYTITEDSLVLTNKKYNFASMKKSCDFIALNDNYIALSINNTLEIWHLPREYKFGMFELKLKNNRHTGPITSIKFIDSRRVITTSTDCTVRILDIDQGDSRKIIDVRSVPVACFVMSSYIVIACKEGQIYYIDSTTHKVEKKIYKQGSISSACNYEDIIGICMWDGKKTTVEIIDQFEVVYSFESSKHIVEMSLESFDIAMKSSDWLGIYNYEKDVYKFDIDLIKISCMDFCDDLVAVGCNDKKIRVYDDNRLVNCFYDEKNASPLYKIHFLKKSICSVAINGYVSIFDTNKGTCYRSFNMQCKLSASEVCNDGMMLFLSDATTYQIKVVDLQRSKEIDILDGHEAPVKKMQFSKGFLFSLSYDNILKRWDVYKSDCNTLEIEKTATSFTIQGDKVYVLLQNEVAVYNLDMEYVGLVSLPIKAQYFEVAVSYDGKYVFLGGQSNKLSVVGTETSTLDQIIKVSRNKYWANYRDVYHKNTKNMADKSVTIEVLDMKHSLSQRKLYFLTRESVFTYGVSKTRYLPLTLDIETTTDAICEYLEKENWLCAHVAILKIRDVEYFAKMTFSVPEVKIESLVSSTPDDLVSGLRHFITDMLSRRCNVYKMYMWMRYLIYHHGHGGNEQQVFIKAGREAYEATLENLYMLQNMIE